MEKKDNLELDTLTNVSTVLSKKKPEYNKSFIGLYISQDGKSNGTNKSRYVYGSINNFTKLLGGYCEENLCDGINMLYHMFSLDDLNVFIYTYFHKTVNGPVILIKSDRTSVNKN